MASLTRTLSDRNQVRSPIIVFRVFSQNKGECKHEFNIRLKDITWDSFLKNLFGLYSFDENHLPTIVLLGDKHKIVLRHTNIKQLIRDALEESFKGFCVNLLVPDFDNFAKPAGQNSPNHDEIKRKKAEINDFAEIFSKRFSLPSMDQVVQGAPHVCFTRMEREENAHVELPVRERTTQLGELHVKRLNDGDLLKMLKDGADLILQTSDNQIVSMKFYNDQLPTFNDTRCKYRNLNLAYECSDLQVPVLIDDEIKFLFNRDAEFIQKMKTMVSDVEKHHREHIVRLTKFHETIRKIKSGKETSNSGTPSTSGVAVSTAPASDASASKNSTPEATASAPMPDVLIPPISEGSSNEGAQSGPRVYRRPHRSAQKRSKRCVTAAQLATVASCINSTSRSLMPSAENASDVHATPGLRREDIVLAFQDLTLSPPPHRLSELAACCYSKSKQSQQVIQPSTSKNATVTVPQETTSDPPAWFGEILDKFKNEVLQDVKNLVQDVLDTSLPASSANDLKTVRVPNSADDQYQYTALDGSPSSSSGKHKHHDKHHHGSGSSKRKSGSLCSKRGGGILGGAENKTTPYACVEKILEISCGLFVYSKSGFKVGMPRNASLTIQIGIGKISKYRNSLEDIELRVQSVSNSIECCVKRVTPASNAGKSVLPDVSIYYDVRIKSKDKSGKFRLYFNLISGGKIVGHSFKVDVRVKKEFTLPFGNSEGILNYETEAFPIPMVENVAQMASSSGTNFIESQKSPVQNSKEENVAAAAAADLADEGIGGNQEDFFSPTSDSECSDVSDLKPDMLLKDEGIDTCYRSVIENVTTVATKCEQPELDSESDTDSSISFLMDENEARDELDDSLDVVQLPSCFIPNIECTDELLPVRIKRKTVAATKRAVTENNDSDLQQLQNITPSAFDTSPLTPVAVATSSSPITTVPVTRTTPSPTPAVTISDDEEDEDVEFLNESIKSAAVDHAYHRSLYPNLQGLKESVRSVTSNDAATNAEPKAESSKQLPTAEPYPHILPDKFFEIWKNAGPLPKTVQDTVTSVLSSVSNEINNAAVAARTAAASAAAAAASIVPNVPMPPSPTAPSAWTVNPENFNIGGDVATQEAAAGATPSTSNDANHTSHSQPPEEKRQKNVAFSFGAQPAQQQQQPGFSFEPQKQQRQQELSGRFAVGNAEHIHWMYKNLSEQMQADLITLHDMGFSDDPYMIYLLEQFPNDLSKVIENLINYSTY